MHLTEYCLHCMVNSSTSEMGRLACDYQSHTYTCMHAQRKGERKKGGREEEKGGRERNPEERRQGVSVYILSIRMTPPNLQQRKAEWQKLESLLKTYEMLYSQEPSFLVEVEC